jgi:ankyrin repeat protein
VLGILLEYHCIVQSPNPLSQCVVFPSQDSGGWTPIIWAAEHKHIKVIRALLHRGADVTLKDKVRLSVLVITTYAHTMANLILKEDVEDL